MKLISWNVNGIRACIQKGFWEWYDSESADVVCLQETKITAIDFEKLAMHHSLISLHEGKPLEFFSEDQRITRRNHPVYYVLNAAEKPGYSGVAMLLKNKPLEIEYGIGKPEFDREGRVIFAHFEKFTLVNVYVPNGGRELERIPFKLKFSDALLKKLEKLRQTQKNIAICGDMNVAHEEIDIKNPKSNANNSGFTAIEREWFTKFLKHGYVDTFRHFHPEARDQYSWWSYRPGVRAKNIGWRIDYFVVTREMLKIVKSAGIQMKVMGSDHCPETLDI